jgi:para-nitrobenzyl esterase
MTLMRGACLGTISAALVACAAAGAVRAQSNPIVAVTGGQVRGAAQGGGAVFKGIPFAAPPTGERRWREPMAVPPWSGVRDATTFGAVCAQIPTPIVGDAGKAASEDCLFLNVWTTQWPAAGAARPVMVWIPGGGNFVGAGSQAGYDGEPLARHGVVVVTINYRLGSLGFFSHPALTRESPRRASGNQGILDQIAALRWVQENIARFGGDPTNVTIFGESAGSLDVSVLMTSPLSKGLFHRAIAESGAVVLVGEPSTLAEAEKRGQAAAARWKVAADAPLETLRAVPTADILTAEPPYFNGDAIPDVFPNLGITVDGYVFTRKPAQVFAAGGQHRVPMMLGSNGREQVPGATLAKDLPQAIARAYGPLAPRALKLYVGAPDPVYGTPAEQWGTDTSFRCSTVAQAMWHAASSPTFAYEFVHVPPERAAVGAVHASELSHVFGTYAQGLVGVGPPARATDADARLSDVMQRYWTNFAKTGDPNGAGLPKWPKFATTSRDYIEFATSGPAVKQSLRRPFCDLFIENVQRVSVR